MSDLPDGNIILPGYNLGMTIAEVLADLIGYVEERGMHEWGVQSIQLVFVDPDSDKAVLADRRGFREMRINGRLAASQITPEMNNELRARYLQQNGGVI